jgi:VWFA-related protein
LTEYLSEFSPFEAWQTFAMKRLCLLIGASVLSPIILSAHQASSPEGSIMPAAGQQIRPVTIDVVVSNRSGKPVRGLQQQDFTVLNDKQPNSLISFRAVDLDAGTPGPPTEMLLVIDAINADGAEVGREREGIKNFLQRNGGRLVLPVSLVTLTDKGMGKLIPASQDGNALAAMLDQNGTGVRFSEFERFGLSLKALDTTIAYESAKPGRKLMVWVSPGWPLLAKAASDLTNTKQRQIFNAVVTTSTALRLGDITLYNVVARGVSGTDVSEFFNYAQFLNGVKAPSQAYPANLALAVFAVQSGGLVLNGSNDLPAALANEVAKSAGDARAFYVLTFQAAQAEHANEYHNLQVKIDQPGVTVRTRTGYYTQP